MTSYETSPFQVSIGFNFSMYLVFVNKISTITQFTRNSIILLPILLDTSLRRNFQSNAILFIDRTHISVIPSSEWTVKLVFKWFLTRIGWQSTILRWTIPEGVQTWPRVKFTNDVKREYNDFLSVFLKWWFQQDLKRLFIPCYISAIAYRKLNRLAVSFLMNAFLFIQVKRRHTYRIDLIGNGNYSHQVHIRGNHQVNYCHLDKPLEGSLTFDLIWKFCR